MQVLKFGGTSVRDKLAISSVREIVLARKAPLVIVVSAISGATNNLTEIIANLKSRKFKLADKIAKSLLEQHLNLADLLNISDKDAIQHIFKELFDVIKGIELLGEVTPKSTDIILSIGERSSSWLVYKFFLQKEKQTALMDAREVIKTNANYNNADVLNDLTEKKISAKCNSLIKTYKIIITQGFVASDKLGATTTLGRGGSDYSAALIAAALKATILEIWTDVDGIMTSDPRIIKNTVVIPEISYEEASELAFFGAKVLHPKTILPAVRLSIPVYVKNTFNPTHPGTRIINTDDSISNIRAIAFRKGITIINIHSNRMLGAYGFLHKVFEVFYHFATPVDLVTTSEVSISLTIENTQFLKDIIKELSIFSTIDIFSGKAIVCAVGKGIRNTSGIASRFFGVLQGVNISMVSIGASEINISIIISEKDVELAVGLLHKEFIEK